MRRSLKSLLCLLLLALLGASALPQIGENPQALLRALSPSALEATETGYRTPEGLEFRLEERSGLLYRLAGKTSLASENLPTLSRLLAAATGVGEGLEGPIQEFFEARAAELAGAGPGQLSLEGYLLELSVTGEAPYTLDFALSLPSIPDEAFPAAAHSLGPADAEHVVREFSDFQCPFCKRFAAEVLPALKAELLERGDVRFEFHHFPLQSIHANALGAAEASECAADVGGEAGDEDAFWRYHDLLFERQDAWSGLSDPQSYFVRLGEDMGLAGDALGNCLAERRHAEAVNDAYAYAGGRLGLTGTPTVFVNGYKLADYTRLEGYWRLIELSEAFGSEALGSED